MVTETSKFWQENSGAHASRVHTIGKECFESAEAGRESFERLRIAAKIKIACRNR